MWRSLHVGSNWRILAGLKLAVGEHRSCARDAEWFARLLFVDRAVSLLNACSIGLRSGEYLGSVTQSRTGRFNHLSHTGNLVHREAIHHHDVAALEGGSKTLFEIGHERCCIHGAIQHEGRDHRTTAQAGDEGDRLPMPVRYMVASTECHAGSGREAAPWRCWLRSHQ